MKNHSLVFGLLIAASTFLGSNAHAQFGSLLQKAKDKVAQKASESLDKKADKPNSDNGTEPRRSNRAIINSNFDFLPGDSVIYAEDFEKNAIGTSPASFKTNGAGSIVTVNNEKGKWLALKDKATYKLSRQMFYPKHFSLEFDILASADQVRDISPVCFGFTADNSVREFTQTEGTYVELQYYNSDAIVIGSSKMNKHVNGTFDLSTDLNRSLHVSLIVEGDRLIVYLDKVKMADTILFMPTDAKNFYISGPWTYNNGAKILISNLKIAKFKA